jgi:hypothetical protein
MLQKTKVLKAVVYTITWTFEGDINSRNRVDVRVRINAKADFKCQKTLGEVLSANWLTGALRNPGKAELGPSQNHRKDLEDLTGFKTIQTQ